MAAEPVTAMGTDEHYPSVPLAARPRPSYGVGVSVQGPPSRTDAEHAGPPDNQDSALNEAYDAAFHLAQTYPVVRLPLARLVDREVSGARWQQICEEISSHGSLGRSYLD